jgi:transcriptional regulator with XRE-family HTH domain
MARGRQLFARRCLDQPEGGQPMPELSVDLDKLATHLKSKMEEEGLSVRAAAKEIGFGASTLSRLLQGNSNENVPDLANINRAVQWVGKSLTGKSLAAKRESSTIADVEVHLRALPGLAKPDVEALVAMVRASYQRAKKLRTERG